MVYATTVTDQTRILSPANRERQYARNVKRMARIMDEPIHYPPQCTIEECPKCEAEATRIANLPTELTEEMECGCTALTKFDGQWTITTKGSECVLDIHAL